MKTRNLVITAIGLLFAVTVSATKVPTLNVIPLKDKKALMAFETSKPVKVEVTLKNQRGETIYYKKSTQAVEDLRLILNFKNLNDGIYNVIADLGNCKISREIKLVNSMVSAVGDEHKAFTPYFKFENIF